ncbi:RagB/SusD family nutrient uptake outer membrane protein [Lacihabitans soyangensis]|jgi:starch-binding outer membrane protein, SusD/RagB family|uniref:RagB/SusD family nutrient uptake outer membrane protein n=1 Tax=Lacihabitans soyangensis TaxID=869394 RepID=A0AAE3KSN8_9BACT|nr:RagB/SusD family nutrient uptake outer membrane protein [Lacihabitans soyangensis]MCP9762789.1 RagB/SusD family nutrient uptake outer membrane protein [Lacihabitans soyangensis]
MKNIKISILAFLVLANLSCSDRLELLPEQSLAGSQAFSSAANAEATLRGVYSQTQLLDVFGSGPQIIYDFQADNTDFVGSFPTLQDINAYVTTSPNATLQAYWQVHYRVINAANSVIENVPNIKDPKLTPEISKRLVAEAKFLRAITHFNLLHMFAQPYSVQSGATPGVPLLLTSFTGEITFPARATVAATYEQIRKDLNEALTDLPAVTTPASRGRATKGAAAGFLSRLHLYKGEYQLAADFANQIVGTPASYALATNYSFYGATPTAEHIFAIINSATDNGRTGSGGWASYHRPAANGGRGDCAMTASLETSFKKEETDKRYVDLSTMVTAADGQRKRMTLKFQDAANNTDLAPLLRTSEVYLTRAEALAELNGINEESLKLVNGIRSRAGLPAWTSTTFTTKEEFVSAILEERRKELCFEGHRKMDLQRRGLPLRTTGPQAALAVFGGQKTVLPLPQREIDLNKSLVQNAGY